MHIYNTRLCIKILCWKIHNYFCHGYSLPTLHFLLKSSHLNLPAFQLLSFLSALGKCDAPPVGGKNQPGVPIT